MAYVVVRYTHFPHHMQRFANLNEARERGHGPDILLLTSVFGEIVEYTRWLVDCERCILSPAKFLKIIAGYASIDIEIEKELERLERLAPEDDPESQDIYMAWVRYWALRAFAEKARKLGYRVFEIRINYRPVADISFKTWHDVYFPLVEAGNGIYLTADWSPHDYGNVLHFIFITTDIEMPVALRYIKTALAKMQEVPNIIDDDKLENAFYDGRAELIYFADSGRVIINPVYPSDAEE